MLPFRLALLFLLIATSTVLHVLPLLAIALLKVVLPLPRLRAACNPLLTGLAASWIGFNSWLWDTFTRTRLTLLGDADLHADGHYLVLANHQSWVDILVLQKVFNRRIPLLRFFLKRQLFWVPLLGLAWWALDFPFMGRYTPRQVAKNPALAGRDIEATRRACEKFRAIPVSIMNFVEGTRFTATKHAALQGRWQHLLPPKAGGMAMAMAVLGERFDSLVDVSIVYPDGAPDFWSFLCGRVPRIVVRIEQREIPADCKRSDGAMDSPFRKRVHRWLLALWDQKDKQIQALRRPS